MKALSWLVALTFLTVSRSAHGSAISFTGTLGTPEDVFTQTFTLPQASSVDFQTWSFGGGTNAAGTLIPPGGFDPFLGVFSGTGLSATIVNGTSDILSNYGSFVGCPPAGVRDVGGLLCGDITMPLVLPAGTYILLLSDGAYIPNAVFDNGTLGEGFTDFTGGVFQTCNTTPTGTTCVNDTPNWAFDLITSGPVSLPEPGSPLLLGIGLLGLAGTWRRSGHAPK